MNFGLIIIGDEILSGKRQDKHLPKVIELLAARGLALAWARYVGDDRARITAGLRDAFASGDLVFSCGGIGATPDDHTRQCAAAALGGRWRCTRRPRELILERMRDVAAEQGLPFEPDRARQRAPPEHGRVSRGRARSSPTRTTRSPASRVGDVHFVPGFPVMAWPMIEWVLDQRYAHLHGGDAQRERSVIVFGAMEATLTPLMEAIEARFPGIKVFSLPSVDHPQWGRHIELGVKGAAATLDAGLRRAAGRAWTQLARELGPEMVR